MSLNGFSKNIKRISSKTVNVDHLYGIAASQGSDRVLVGSSNAYGYGHIIGIAKVQINPLLRGLCQFEISAAGNRASKMKFAIEQMAAATRVEIYIDSKQRTSMRATQADGRIIEFELPVSALHSLQSELRNVSAFLAAGSTNQRH